MEKINKIMKKINEMEKINENEVKGMSIPTVIDYITNVKKIGFYDIIENQNGLFEIIFQSTFPCSTALTEEVNVLCDKDNKVSGLYHWRVTDL